jgi:phosphotriesterase-related protein
VIGVGRYLAPTFTEAELTASVDELVDRWTEQAETGIDGLLPGVIGEIGTSPELADEEVVSLRAAARVQDRTELPINVHVHPYARRALDVLRILDAEGADLTRVALSHCDGEMDVDWLLGLLRSGCYVEMDQLGTGPERLIQGRGYPSDAERIAGIAALCDNGYADRILLSHDICMRNSLRRFGGHGYAHLGRTFAPQLARAIGQDLAFRITNTNPLAFLHWDTAG